MELELGPYRDRVDARLERWAEMDLPGRLKEKDLSLWRTRKGRVTDMLGWLSLRECMRSQMDDIIDLSRQACSDGITDVVLLGMGGSSMAPLVFRKTFGVADEHPDLTVLDTTHPDEVSDEVRGVMERIDPSGTLFIVSSKSGGTIETMSLYNYFWDEMSSAVTDAGRHFVAITDPGTPLAKLASGRRFRKTFEGSPDVGGRYSALSAFGLVPAALIGVDVRSMLEIAFDAWEGAAASNIRRQEGLVLGAALGELAGAGRDKATILTSDPLQSFPPWTEQLIAESTGKDGSGLIPVAGEPWLDPSAYSSDRTFIGISLVEEDRVISERLGELADAGHPTMHMIMEDRMELGRVMFEWELAIASAAMILGIDPFDQPDVQAAKELAWTIVSEGSSMERGEREVSTYHLDEPDELMAAAEEWAEGAQEGDYIAIQAFLGCRPEVQDELGRLQGDLLTATGLPTTLGHGPRYLHSTGQLHKGGPNTGLFLQLVDRTVDLPVPGEGYSFRDLTRAEALGDIMVLNERGRRTLRVDLDDEGAEGVAKLRDLLNVMFQTRVVSLLA